jgi:mono/diheme cytochrome c family protein
MSDSKQRPSPKGRSRFRCAALFALVGLALIWGGLPQVPAHWGIHFGSPYLIFFSLCVLGSALFFLLLNWGPTRQPHSSWMTFVSILLVYGATVGGVVAFGLWYYPQFETPRLTSAPEVPNEQAQAAQERGKEIFALLGCFACHSIEKLGIRGGQRGPDLSDVGHYATIRKPSMSAEAYLMDSIKDPASCLTPLPDSGLTECQSETNPAITYPPLMPPGLADRMSEAQRSDLIAFLMSLKESEK